MGSLVCGKALGVFELEQTQSGKTIRNDRIVVLPTALGRDHKLLSLTDLPHGLLFQIEHFFIGYARQEGKQILPVGRGDEDRALAIIAAAARHYRKKQ
jgi:inorganic pyrophosphatase